MIPGEYQVKPGQIAINVGRATCCIIVENHGDRPIQVGSHYHFAEVNPALLTYLRRALRRDIDGEALADLGRGDGRGFNPTPVLDALREIRGAVSRTDTLLFDSGVRGGADVFKAIACGADAVTIGRPSIYGLAIDGRRGVEAVLRNIIAEFDLTMALAGVRSLAEIDASTVRTREAL